MTIPRRACEKRGQSWNTPFAISWIVGELCTETELRRFALNCNYNLAAIFDEDVRGTNKIVTDSVFRASAHFEKVRRDRGGHDHGAPLFSRFWEIKGRGQRKIPCYSLQSREQFPVRLRRELCCKSLKFLPE